MKKSLTYVVTAILLGTVVMLFPVLMLYPSQISTMRGMVSLPTFQPSPAHETLEDVQKATIEAEIKGLAPFPLSLAYAGFILMLGFVVGLSVSWYYKRRLV